VNSHAIPLTFNPCHFYSKILKRSFLNLNLKVIHHVKVVGSRLWAKNNLNFKFVHNYHLVGISQFRRYRFHALLAISLYIYIYLCYLNLSAKNCHTKVWFKWRCIISIMLKSMSNLHRMYTSYLSVQTKVQILTHSKLVDTAQGSEIYL